jgi:hypothetical protein
MKNENVSGSGGEAGDFRGDGKEFLELGTEAMELKGERGWAWPELINPEDFRN